MEKTKGILFSIIFIAVVAVLAWFLSKPIAVVLMILMLVLLVPMLVDIVYILIDPKRKPKEGGHIISFNAKRAVTNIHEKSWSKGKALGFYNNARVTSWAIIILCVIVIVILWICGRLDGFLFF